MPNTTKIDIQGRTYVICNQCGAFVASPRCLACSPIGKEDSFIREEISRYYDDKHDIVDNKLKRKTKTKTTKHHILEYFFNRETLIKHNRYFNVPEREIITVRTRDHNRKLGTYKLHEHLSIMDESLLDTEEGVNYLLENIPPRLLELFEEKGVTIPGNRKGA